MGAIIYLRVSTGGQATSGLGLEAQEDSCRAWCDAHGMDVVGVYTDAGISGSAGLDKRPALLDATVALSKGDALIVAKRDRIGRDVIVCDIVERIVEKKGCRVVSTAGEGSGGTDPASVMLRQMLDVFAGYERAIIGARTKAALAAKRARGERTGGSLPYGYRLAADGVRLEEDETEQEALGVIDELRAGGTSYRKITEALGELGHRPRGSRWHLTHVVKLSKRDGRSSVAC